MALSFGSRLLKEYRSVVRHSTAGAADSESGDVLLLFPNVGDDSLRNWTAFIRASADTPYADVFLELRIRVPNTYPLQPPSIVFETAVFHPNVHFKSGEICIDILKKEWSPAWTLESSLRAVLALLAAGESESPLNCDAGNLLRAGDIKGFNSLARMYSIEHGLTSEHMKPRVPEQLRHMFV